MSPTTPSTAPHEQGEPSVGQLVTQLSEQTSRLVRDELALARAELTRSAKHAGLGAGLFGVAGLVALFGVAALVAAAIIALAWWLAALVVGLVLLLTGGALALVGKQQVQQVSAPERTVANVKLDVDTVKESSHGHAH
ncbi:MAG: phage holin family protein [Intrasporangium sp.]|uniref:phage holin family protein n=1 Tax=Intrasporangium sp. TaxID=1925024 RepID=UPI002647221F|nr:phage holin family protein [Intrasporangium sp.]MDN5797636.1 phage holin family protein [Intrasporangium sp.]